MRIFIAIKIPNEIKEKISNTYMHLFPGFFKKVEKENLHITLKFIGEADTKKVQKITEKLSAIKHKKFTATISTIGEFGKRVVWIGIGKGAQEMDEIAQKMNEILQSNERFHAHITLARTKNVQKKIENTIEKLGKIHFEEKFLAESISIIKSTLTARGAKYEEIYEKLLE